MPKPIFLGNGQMLLGLDEHGQVYDLYFPNVGLENHTSGNLVHKIGVFAEGKLRWLDHPSWQVKLQMHSDSMVGEMDAINTELQVRLQSTDIVYNEKNIFIRQFTLHNISDTHREIKLYINQQFEIYESHRGDSAYYDPVHQVIVHYKGRRLFLANARHTSKKSFDEYSIGLLGIEGKEGTYKDAEDGKLECNPVEHGLVDSVIGLKFEIHGKSSEGAFYWLTAAKFFNEIYELNDYVISRSPQYLIKSTQDFWEAWSGMHDLNLECLKPPQIDLFQKSLLIIRSHIDDNGAIIASGDTDLLKQGRGTYSYVWPRDASTTVIALDKAGYYNVTEKFFQFASEVITKDGYFLHKYRADKSFGSSWHPWVRDGKAALPIQEDETALVIYALWEHYHLDHNLEFIEKNYNGLIKLAAEFMVNYIDEETQLPKPSYDLWEEKYGVHTFTACAVYGALNAAANFARLLGKDESAAKYQQKAEAIKEAILTKLYNKQTGFFYKSIVMEDGQQKYDDTIDSSSIFGIIRFDVLPIDDPMVKTAAGIWLEKLKLPTSVGGVARYTDDKYFRGNDKYTGNPWMITTLWLAQYYIRTSKHAFELKKAEEIIDWVGTHALSTGVLSEQLDPETGAQLSASPLVWSHSEFVATIIDYVHKLEEFGICVAHIDRVSQAAKGELDTQTVQN